MTESADTGGRTTRSVRSALGRARPVVPSWGRLRLGRAQRVAVGVGIGLAALLVKAVLNALLGGEAGLIPLTVSVVVAAWIAGFPGGLAATLVTAIANTILFVAPAGADLELTSIDLARMALYAIGATAVALLVGSVGSSRDRLEASLGELASMADVIRRRDERLELVLAASGTGFWEWDVTTGELVWSEAIFQQHGLDPSDGAPTFDRYLQTVHPDDVAAFRASIDDALAHGSGFSSELRLVWPDGSIHWTHGVGRVFRNAAGEPIRMVGTGQDITQRQRLEEERDRLLDEERRASTFREAFIDVISHELRTPITTIFGLTQVLGRPGRLSSSEDQAELIRDIAAESERLHRLVEDLLVLTRAERGEIAIESEPIELRRIVTRTIEREAARLPSIRIEADLPRGLPIVAGEDTYVEQIVRNMLSNAAKYTPPGTLVTVRAEQEGDTVVVRVCDSGPGIDQGSAERAFELFFRDPTVTRSIAGSGIGLFVCASLVEAMGGRIWAKRRPEGGSEFGFTLRVIPDDEAVLAASMHASA